MWLETQIFCEDLESIHNCKSIPWDLLRNKTFFVTGGTGLIGSTIISALLYADMKQQLNLTVVALVRNLTAAREQFAPQLKSSSSLKFVVGDVLRLPAVEYPIHYIIHGANPTSSLFFVQHPVETSITAVQGTDRLLQLAREKKTEGFVYLSTMEVYGHPLKSRKVRETDAGVFHPLDIRNSYPFSKLLCENLCYSYQSEYGVPVQIVRLTQCFGPGVRYTDNRVFAEFARCAIERRNIILKTKGNTERSYLYTADAVTAILTVLLKGKSGEIYNAANENTYCSILEMANLVAGNRDIKVEIKEADIAESGYADTIYMDLDTEKIRSLGWKATVGLLEMYQKTIKVMTGERIL